MLPPDQPITQLAEKHSPNGAHDERGKVHAEAVDQLQFLRRVGEEGGAYLRRQQAVDGEVVPLVDVAHDAAEEAPDVVITGVVLGGAVECILLPLHKYLVMSEAAVVVIVDDRRRRSVQDGITVSHGRCCWVVGSFLWHWSACVCAEHWSIGYVRYVHGT